MRFELDPDSGAPLYQRLADAIRLAIESGELARGSRLPTVRALSSEQDIAGGTIRQAYDLLAQSGHLTMTRGKGTFVRESRPAPPSRARRATDAIGALIGELSALGFSPREMRMYFDLKLGELDDGAILTPVAVVDDSRELLAELIRQLCVLPGIELTEHLMRDVRRLPPELMARYPLIVTTQRHHFELCALLPGQADRIARAAVTPSPETLVQLARADLGAGVGVLCQTPAYGELILDALRLLPELDGTPPKPFISGGGDALSRYLEGRALLLTSPDYLRYITEGEQAALEAARACVEVIPCRFQLDRGSFLVIEQMILQPIRQKPLDI